jgi:hypothetical protein
MKKKKKQRYAPKFKKLNLKKFVVFMSWIWISVTILTVTCWGNSKRRGNFLLVRKLRMLTCMAGVGALVLFEFATLLRESWIWNVFNTDGGINFIEFWMV